MKKPNLSQVNLYCNALMVLTSIHHIYGAILYHTPWRNHVLLLSIPVILALVFLKHLLGRRPFTSKSFLFRIYGLIVLIPSIIFLGIFEGVYNHLLKNILFFSGLNSKILALLFPPPTYEMPNDFWFEFSGILQAIVLIPLMHSFIKLVQQVSGTKVR